MSRNTTGILRTAVGGIFVLALASASWAGPREQAKRMHDRLTGIPPSATVLDAMETLIATNDVLGAADLAM